MANPEHVRVVKGGPGAIEAWRKEHPGERWDLGGANLGAADLSQDDLSGAYLSGANLGIAQLYGANLSNAILSHAYLGQANLGYSILHKAQMSQCDLSEAFLGRADLSRADLSMSTLGWADLRNANLTGANLQGAVVTRSDLRWADLRHSDLRRTNLGGARLTGANLSGAHVGWTVFGLADLSEVVGLEQVEPDGPSVVGVDTIFMSGGKIPEVFLRGCWVPESLIVRIPELVKESDLNMLSSCFLSHSSADKPFVRRLYDRMVGEKMRVWLDEKEIIGGRKLHEQIENAIQAHDKLILVLSENSLKSEWVGREIRKAWQKQQQAGGGQLVLFPIRLCSFDALQGWGPINDPASGKDLCDEVRDYFIPDFSEWKDDAKFEAQFAGLVKALKAAALSDQASLQAEGLAGGQTESAKPPADAGDEQTLAAQVALATPNLQDESQRATADRKLDAFRSAIEEEGPSEGAVATVKRLLSDPTGSISLHDLVMKHVKKLAAETSTSRLPVQGLEFSAEEIVRRLQFYEEASRDLGQILACVGYWGNDAHRDVLCKSLSRMTDQLGLEAGSTRWMELKWYPSLLLCYLSGMGSVAGGKYENLRAVFEAPVGRSNLVSRHKTFALAIGDSIVAFNRSEVFDQLPGHERFYVPRSEYLFKCIQPEIEDALFLGEEYETVFNRFEVLLALANAFARKREGGNAWGPYGRFCWKVDDSPKEEGPLPGIIEEAEAERERWAPLRSGLFGGDIDAFLKVAREYAEHVKGLGYH